MKRVLRWLKAIGVLNSTDKALRVDLEQEYVNEWRSEGKLFGRAKAESYARGDDTAARIPERVRHLHGIPAPEL